MEGRPADFEAIGNRLGLQVVHEDDRLLRLAWRGPRFPAFLCLGLSLLLLFISLPIVQALRQQGFVGPAGSLWYFPVMNLILFFIAAYLLTQKRTIEVDCAARQVKLKRKSIFTNRVLSLGFPRIEMLRLALDHVYSGFAVAGSSAAESFPVPSLRLIIADGGSVLLDRGNRKKLAELGQRIAERLDKPLVVEQTAAKGPPPRKP
jgi:hypothetical protein